MIYRIVNNLYDPTILIIPVNSNIIYKNCNIHTDKINNIEFNIKKNIITKNWTVIQCPNKTIETKSINNIDININKKIIPSNKEMVCKCLIPQIYQIVNNKYKKYLETRKIDGRNN